MKDRLIMLPGKGRVVFVPSTDTGTEVPRVILPDDPNQPPVFIPGPTLPPPPIPGVAFVTHDIRGLLPTDSAWSIGSAPKNSLTIHWEGATPIPALSVDGHTTYLQAIAGAHIRKNWSATGTVHGDGIMYHECIGQNGDIFLMREDGAILYHANNQAANVSSRAILVLCSRETPPTQQQLASLRQRVAAIRSHWATNARVHPHSFWTGTECPGDAIRAVVAGL